MARAQPRLIIPGEETGKPMPDSRSANIVFNIEQIPGLIGALPEIQTPPTDILDKPAPGTPEKKEGLWSKFIALPNVVTGIVTTITGWSFVRRIVGHAKFLRYIAYMMPVFGALFLWLRLKKGKRPAPPVVIHHQSVATAPPAPTAPPLFKDSSTDVTTPRRLY